MVDEKEKFRNQVISNLRACLISSQGGIPATSLIDDYKQLLGETIPFKKLGYNSVESLLKSVPDITIKTVNGVTLVEAKTTSSSNHISKLVQNQRKTSKKRSKRRRNLKDLSKTQAGKPLSLPPRFQQNARFPRRRRATSSSEKNASKESKGPSGENWKSVGQNSNSSVHPTPPPLFRPLNSSSRIIPPQLPPGNNHSTFPNFTSSTPVEYFNITQTRNPPFVPIQQLPPLFPKESHVPSAFQPNLFSSSSCGLTPVELLKQQTLDICQRFLQLPNHNDFIPPQPQKEVISSQKQLPPKKKPAAKNNVHRGHKMTDCEWLPIPADLPANSYFNKLMEFTQERGWPEPEVCLLRQKRGNVTCIVSLKGTKPGAQSDLSLTNEDFTTYPDEIRDATEALEQGTKKAYDSLVQRNSVNYRVTCDSDLILRRIAKMVEEKTNGVWAFKIERDYMDDYQERLPNHWIDLVMGSNILCAADLGHAYVVKPSASENFEENSSFFVEDNAISSNQRSGLNQDIKNNKNLVSSQIKKKLVIPNLRPPESDQWDVYISRVCSYLEVWIRLIGDEYSQELENLTTDMELSYSFDENPSATTIEVDNYYVALTEDSAFRVIVKNLYENEAAVHFLDYGDDDNVPLSCIREMKEEFYKLPSQSLLVCLSGMDYASKFDFKEELMDSIIGKSFIALVEERDPYCLVLYDTSDSTIIEINKILSEIINKEMLYQPIDLQVDSVNEIQISHIDEHGKVFIKLARFSALKFLEDVLDSINKGNYKRTTVETIDCNKKYFYEEKGRVYRIGFCLKTAVQKYVDAVFIDEGRTERILVSEIFEITEMAEILNNIPNQAVPIYLKDIPPSKLTKNRVNKLKEIAPPNRPVISKVVEHKDLPVLELFVRNQIDRLLCSVNHTIELEDLLNDEITENYVQQFEKLQITDPKKVKLPMNSRTLTTPGFTKAPVQLYDDDIFVWTGTGDIFSALLADLPTGEEYFEIYVSEAANPTNFTIQPLKYVHDLNKLTQEMKIFYDNIKPMVVSAFQYNVYAVRQSDDFWYRACVHKVLNETITVKLCDFGHLYVVPLQNLRPLHKKFMELPFLGFTAKLAGIKPKHQDWNVSDCLAIKQMIKGKKLISVIKEILPTRDSIILSLDIIDTTSSTDDINISHQLVIEGRAVYI